MGAVSYAYVNTVDVGCHVKWCAFHLVGCYLNTLMLQLMAGAERLCHIFDWVARLRHILKRGREMKKVGNHWSSICAKLKNSPNLRIYYSLTWRKLRIFFSNHQGKMCGFLLNAICPKNRHKFWSIPCNILFKCSND